MNLDMIDRQLIRAAASDKRSPKELSKAVNGLLSPEKAAARLIELLDESDWLTVVQERRLLIMNLRELLDALYEEAITHKNPKLIGEYRKTLENLADRILGATINLDDVTTKLTRAYAEHFAKAIGAAFDQMPKALEEAGVTIDMEEINGVFQEVLPVAVAILDANTDDA